MKKKNHYLSLVTLVVATVLISSFALYSCSDGESYVPSPTITDANGNKVQVTSVGGVSFTYDESGKLTSLSDGYDTYVLQDDKFTISDDMCKAEIYLNEDGYITKIVYSEGDESDDKLETIMKYSYKSNRIKSCSATCKGKERSESWNGNGKISYTWKEDNLTEAKVEYEENGKDDGESYNDSYTSEYVYTYGTQNNPSKQLPYYMGVEITDFEDLGGLFSVIGLFGNGPKYLPASYVRTKIEVEDGQTYKPKSASHTLAFTQNSNGTLRSESRDGSIFNYNYSSTRSDSFGAKSLKEYIHCLRNISQRHR